MKDAEKQLKKETVIKIFQLQENQRRRDGARLESWVKIANLDYFPKKVNSTLFSREAIQSNLEDIYCNNKCLHRYKVCTKKTTLENPDIFETPKW